MSSICGLRLKQADKNPITVFDLFCTKKHRIARTINLEPGEVLFSIKYNCQNFLGCNIRAIIQIRDLKNDDEFEKAEDFRVLGNQWTEWRPLAHFLEGDYLIQLNCYERPLNPLARENLESTLSFILQVEKERQWVILSKR